MISLRYKKTKQGKFSVYLDIYVKDEIKKRNYEFLRIYVSKDYSKSKKILAEDKVLMELANNIRSKRELELSGSIHKGYVTKRINVSLVNFITELYQKTDRKRYQYFIAHLQRFSKGKDILFSDITLRWIDNFHEYLLSRMTHNSAIIYLNQFKAIINKAHKEEIIYTNPFERYVMPNKQEIERTYLELHEIQKLIETPTDFHQQLRQAFIFSCFTGLRFSDIRGLKMSYIQTEKDKNGEEYTALQIRPLKTKDTTGQILKVPLSEQAIKTLSEVDRINTSELVFDRLPQKDRCNTLLKEWAKKAGITKNLHFHVGRHTFATMCLTSGVDIYSTSKLMGHTRISVTQIYAKIIDEKKQAEINKFPNLF